MATGKITKRAVEAVPVPPLGKREHLWDDTLKGFGVMVTDKGVRSYLIQYRMGGRGTPTRRVTIGRHGSPWTAEKAREYAADLLQQVRKGVDPFLVERQREEAQREAAAKAETQRKEATRLAFGLVADRFVEKYAKVEQPKTWRDTESIIRRDLKPHFGETPLPHITDADIIELLDRVHERGDSAAIKAYKALRSMFGWAKDKRLIAASPMREMSPPAKIGKRKRVLTDHELKLVWQAAGALGWPFGPIVHLLILTGQRLREVAEAPWTEFNLDKAEWLLPGARTKNGEANYVPLSEQALAILRGLPVLKSENRYIFTTTGRTPVSGFSRTKAKVDAMVLDSLRRDLTDAGDEPARAALEPWTIHDLRRTLATGCQRLGVKLEVTESILNHVSGSRSGIVGVYQTYRYQTEVRDALAAWGRHVEALISGKQQECNVVQLAPMRA